MKRITSEECLTSCGTRSALHIVITFDDFQKVEMRVGKILSAERVPETDKLLKLQAHFGKKLARVPVPDLENNQSPINNIQEEEDDIRQIVSGIFEHFPDPQVLVGKKCMFVTNLKPRTIKGLESDGMLFAISTNDGKFSLLEPNDSIVEGTRAQ